ncbi:receptor like protein 12 [Hibiscus trionum]|uniref:Receptor like protein 12 n=1 Tax=Hibiscus trionum TaxID=183268 RepID=A0A9W7MHX2_HIBTR|nr:receptor like protein 12 [Hibiscus trionum]
MGLLLQHFLLKCLLFLILPYFLTQCVSSVQRPCLDSERSALLQLKESFILNRSASSYSKADSWKLDGWIGGDCCSWDGVECDDNTGHVIGLDLRSSFLYGSIDSNSTIFQLHHLRRLNLFDNDFNGSEIPSVIGNLSRLSQLDLSYSAFSGQIPNTLANLTELTYLSLSENDFSPSTLSWLGKLSKLTILGVASTNSYGDVLPSLKNLTRLTSLRLSRNQFSSQILFWLGNFTRLTRLDLGVNKFWGLVPESIFTLIKLEFLSLWSNLLNGTYKLKSFLNLRNLKQLQLSGNNFSLLTTTTVMNVTVPKFTILTLASCNLFEFPNFLSGQDELEFLDLSRNKIHGYIPKWIWGLSAQTLGVLHLKENFLTGFRQPAVVPPWTNLRRLDLGSNRLRGNLPILPASIYYYFVSNNFLQGEIPSMICTLSSIIVLDISNNSFSGMIPPFFHQPAVVPPWTNMRELDLGSNRLRGNLPIPPLQFTITLSQTNLIFDLSFNIFVVCLSSHYFQRWEAMKVVDVSTLRFVGCLPSHQFRRWEAMKVVDVSTLRYLRANASFETPGTSWMENITYSMTMTKTGVVTNYDKIQDVLVAMDLSRNRFECGIPEDIQILKAVQFLNLSINLLSGSIPSSLLTGPIPQDQQFGTFESNSFEGNLGLCGKPLSKKFYPEGPSPPPPSFSQRDGGGDSWFEFGWKTIMLGFGSGVVNKLVLGYLFNPMKHKWFVKYFGRKLHNRRRGRRN